MFHRTTLLRLKARDGAAIFTLATVFVNTSRVCTQYRGTCLPISVPIVQHSRDMRTTQLCPTIMAMMMDDSHSQRA